MDAQARALTADAFTYTGAAVRRGAVYTNSTYGFTVRFPDGWAGRVEVAEDDGAGLMTIYQSSARRATTRPRACCKSVRGHPGGI